MNHRHMLRGLGLLLLVSSILTYPSFLSAQTTEPSVYQLGSGDRIQISVWQQPDLDRELRVRDDGTIVVPLIGEIQAAGMTIPELEAELTRKLRGFNRDISEVSVTVLAYESLQLFVMGAVANPGSISFEAIPTLWEAIRRAGGPLPAANLRRVRIMRQQDGTTTVQVVNISGVLDGRDLEVEMPQLQPGDTIIVPDRSTLTAADRADGVSVFGVVTSPGLYPLEGPTPLMTVIMQAGGFGARANLKNIRVVHPTTPGGPTKSTRVNAKLYFENGQAVGNPMVNPGDTVYVESSTNFLLWLRTVPGLVASIAAFTVLMVGIFR